MNIDIIANKEVEEGTVSFQDMVQHSGLYEIVNHEVEFVLNNEYGDLFYITTDSIERLDRKVWKQAYFKLVNYPVSLTIQN